MVNGLDMLINRSPGAAGSRCSPRARRVAVGGTPCHRDGALGGWPVPRNTGSHRVSVSGERNHGGRVQPDAAAEVVVEWPASQRRGHHGSNLLPSYGFCGRGLPPVPVTAGGRAVSGARVEAGRARSLAPSFRLWGQALSGVAHTRGRNSASKGVCVTWTVRSIIARRWRHLL